jgi:hypothetical protein
MTRLPHDDDDDLSQGGWMGGWLYGSLAAHIQGVLRTNTLELKRTVFFVILSQNEYSPFSYILFP